MMSLLAMNPDRPFVKGAVFNGAEVVLHMAVRGEKETQLFESHELNLLTGDITQTFHVLPMWRCKFTDMTNFPILRRKLVGAILDIPAENRQRGSLLWLVSACFHPGRGLGD
jgi:hypothetical protein